MSDQVVAAIRRAIQDHGPITFAEFMEMALYGPGGFYEEPPVGERGHFLTSPHVHPVFAELIAQGLRRMWEFLGQPDPFRLVEVGAGDGTLARHLVAALSDLPVEYLAVERSSGARSRLQDLPVQVAASMEVIGPGITGCIIANELLDNLPFHWVRKTKAGLRQVCVSIEGDRFEAVERACDDEEIIEGTPQLKIGQEAAVSLESLQFVDRLARVFRRGYAILIDYGDASGRPAGPIHGYRGHRALKDVLADPGTSDITAAVDFASLMNRAKAWGLASFGPVSQRAVLMALGFAAWGDGQRARQVEALEKGAGREAVRRFGDRGRAGLLVDPAGLGSLAWVFLATQDLEWPQWVVDAERRDVD